MTFHTVLPKAERKGSQGEKHWNAKVSDRERREIIRRINQGESYSAIAQDYGISNKQIQRIYTKGFDRGISN